MFALKLSRSVRDVHPSRDFYSVTRNHGPGYRVFPICGNHAFHLRAAARQGNEPINSEEKSFPLVRAHLRATLQLGTTLACSDDSKTFIMKPKALLLIASLVTLASLARAAQSQNESDLVVLPAYVVTAPRLLPVEQRINESLDELRVQAHKPLVNLTDLGLAKPQVAPSLESAGISREKKVPLVAKS